MHLHVLLSQINQNTAEWLIPVREVCFPRGKGLQLQMFVLPLLPSRFHVPLGVARRRRPCPLSPRLQRPSLQTSEPGGGLSHVLRLQWRLRSIVFTIDF